MNFAKVIPTPLRRYGTATVTLLDQGAVSAVNFLTVVIVARQFTLKSFGIFMLVQTLLTLLTTLQNSLVTQPHNILGAQRQGVDYARLTLTLGILQLATSVAIGVIAALAGLVLLRLEHIEYASIAFALALTVLPWMGQEFVRRVLYTQGDVPGAAINDWLSYGLQLIAIGALALRLGGLELTPSTALFAMGASSLVAMLFGLWQIGRRHAVDLSAAKLQLRTPGALGAACADSWRLSKWLVAQQGAAALGASGHGWLLAALLGPASFGVYRAAYQVVNILNPLRQAACNHLPSQAARIHATRGATALQSWQRRLTWQLFIPFALCALLIVVLAAPLARIMYGNTEQLPALHSFVALGALAYVLNFARTPLDFSLLASGGAQFLLQRTVWLAVFVLTVGALLIWQVGIFGALISEIGTALLATALTYRAYVASTKRTARNAAAVPFAPACEVSKP